MVASPNGRSRKGARKMVNVVIQDLGAEGVVLWWSRLYVGIASEPD